MDLVLLIRQYNSIVLTLISSRLYELTDDRSIAYFHDEERSDLFFIHLNEYLNTTFNSPLDNNIQISVFQLMTEYCRQYSGNYAFERFVEEAERVQEFFFKPRFYKYYLSPHNIDLEISFAELINFQANYSKHSFYHLNILKKRLKKIFEQNSIPDFEKEDYNEHLSYFKEAVLDDRLNFNQTKILEVLGGFFLKYWELLNSPDKNRITEAIQKFIAKNGRLAKWEIEEPKNMTEAERFYWEIKGISFCKRERIEDLIPETDQFLVEPTTSKNNVIERHK